MTTRDHPTRFGGAVPSRPTPPSIVASAAAAARRGVFDRWPSRKGPAYLFPGASRLH